MTPMVFAFDNEHPVGSICRFPCIYCGETASEIGTFVSDDVAKEVSADQAPPLFIKRIATRYEWLAWCKENAKSGYSEQWDAPYFYEVSTD
jgi:hypothetical protein